MAHDVAPPGHYRMRGVPVAVFVRPRTNAGIAKLRCFRMTTIERTSGSLVSEAKWDGSVKYAWDTFKRFWNAEEVPRWFGLSVVIVYLTGLGAVAHFGIAGVRREANESLLKSARYMAEGLAGRLDSLGSRAATDADRKAGFQRELYRFATQVPTRLVRIVDGRRRIIASSDSSETGTVVPWNRLDAPPSTDPGVPAVEQAGRRAVARLIRVPLHATTAEPQAEGDGSDSALFLEVVLLGARQTGSAFTSNADSLAVVLVAFGVLFGLYRCLRAQLRSVSRIADRLRLHRADLEQDLASLRIADTLDNVTSAWNELVDLTEGLLETARRTEANEELKAALERTSGESLAEALNAIPDGFLYISDEVRFEYLNAAAHRLLGWNEQDRTRVPLPEAEAHGPGAKILEVLRDSLGPNGSFESRTAMIEGDGQDQGNASTYRMWVFPLHRAHHDGECVVLVRDVSQQRRADRAREDFVTQVTHELRTPLTNIRAYAETLSSGMFDDPKVVTECYNVITKETRRLSRLIEDILSVSQLEVGSIDLQLDNVDLKSLLSDGVRDVRGLADEKNIDLQLILPPKMEPIRGDRDKLAVVLNNLLGNAIKYTANDGEVIIGCQFSGDAVVITFKDNGMGIDPADHGRIFEKFQRGRDAETQSETGTGIGLYTAREIVRRHGGDIELISRKGEGATFLVRLPHRESRAIAMTTAGEA